MLASGGVWIRRSCRRLVGTPWQACAFGMVANLTRPGGAPGGEPICPDRGVAREPDRPSPGAVRAEPCGGLRCLSRPPVDIDSGNLGKNFICPVFGSMANRLLKRSPGNKHPLDFDGRCTLAHGMCRAQNITEFRGLCMAVDASVMQMGCRICFGCMHFCSSFSLSRRSEWWIWHHCANMPLWWHFACEFLKSVPPRPKTAQGATQGVRGMSREHPRGILTRLAA